MPSQIPFADVRGNTGLVSIPLINKQNIAAMRYFLVVEDYDGTKSLTLQCSSCHVVPILI
jgi:hypothetical protein